MLLEYKTVQEGETVKLSIFLMSHMHKLWTVALSIFAGRSDSWVSNSGSTLGRQRCLCNHTPIEGSLLSRAFHRNLSDAERERWKEGDQGRRESAEEKEKGSASAAPSARLQSWLWISMPLMKSADVERMYSSTCVCVWEENKSKQLLELCYCVCSLCNMSATLLRPLLYSNFGVYYKHDPWGMMLLSENSVVQFQYSRLYGTVLRCLTELAVEVFCAVRVE